MWVCQCINMGRNTVWALQYWLTDWLCNNNNDNNEMIIMIMIIMGNPQATKNDDIMSLCVRNNTTQAPVWSEEKLMCNWSTLKASLSTSLGVEQMRSNTVELPELLLLLCCATPPLFTEGWNVIMEGCQHTSGPGRWNGKPSELRSNMSLLSLSATEH